MEEIEDIKNDNKDYIIMTWEREQQKHSWASDFTSQWNLYVNKLKEGS